MLRMLAALVLVPLAAAAQPKGLEGDWTCQGTSPQGEYRLALKVEPRADGVYVFRWSAGPHVTQIGLALHAGRTVSIAAIDQQSGAILTIAYDAADGRLDGQWTGGRDVYLERCERAGSRAAD